MSGPRSWQPLDEDGKPNLDRKPVELFQHRPGTTDELAEWCGGQVLTVNGGAVVLVPGTKAARQVVGLGDYAAHLGDRYWSEAADGFATRYAPAD